MNGTAERASAQALPRRPALADWRYRGREHRGLILAIALFAAMFWLYVANHPSGLSASVASTAANKGVLLALAAMAQTVPILTSGLDLSVGSTLVLANCVASAIVVGGPAETALGVLAILTLGAGCGAVNGAIVVLGRLQPIIATLASGAVYFGLALFLRPSPGGQINEAFADGVTGSLPGGIPVPILLLAGIVLLVWLPFRRSVSGRAAYAVGSLEQAAYMSGVPVRRAKFLAYVMSGLFAAMAGLMLTCVTYSGEASADIGNAYTLNSIAAVVIGGTSLFGGSGGAVGSIFGAFVLRTIGDLLFVFDLDALWQPLFLGVVLLLAVSLDSFRLLRIRNKLDLYR
ncbi:MAG: ABC transporter permease [Alphaproteobacteria bacterium]|nr:ABC transporter permease [Alphaproteobacteria bacterium]